MALIELSDETSVGKYVRVKIREYEARHSPDIVYFTDLKGMWELRITRGVTTRGTAYITAPEAAEKVAVIRWPEGGINIVMLSDAQSMEGFIIAALKHEEESGDVQGTQPS